MKFDKDNKESCERFTYGSGSGAGSVGMGPYNFVTRKITSDMWYIACEIHQILVANRSLFQLDDIDMSTVLNHCTLIIYYDGKGLKEKLSLGIHYDCVYSVTDGKYIQLVDTQV